MALAFEAGDMLPLFGGMPGGPELLIVFVLFMLAIPIAVGVGLFLLGRWTADRGDEEVELLHDRINELEDEVEARKAVAGEDETQAEAAAASSADDDELDILRDRINTLEAEVEAREQVGADDTDDADRER